ncbi:MAG: zincin-like metallopeptidase toxin domain-containing protein [Planctomycetaceae bacterium]
MPAGSARPLPAGSPEIRRIGEALHAGTLREFSREQRDELIAKLDIVEEAFATGVGFLPLVGDMADLANFIEGRDLITDEDLGITSRFVLAVAVILPFVSGNTVRKIKELLGKLTERLRRAGRSPASDKLLQAAESAVRKSDDFENLGAPRGTNWLTDTMKGWRNGEVIPDNVLKRLSSRLNRNNVSIIKNDWAKSVLDKTGDAAQFVRFRDGSAGILLRPNATRYQLLHELKHYEHWLANKKLYGQLSRLEREEFVFKALQESHYWKSLTAAEQKHAIEHIEYFRRLFRSN